MIMFTMTVSLLGCSGCEGEDENHSESIKKELRQKFVVATAEKLQEANIPGLAVAVIRPNGKLWAHGFGSANLETGSPVTPFSVMATASLSKMLTATAAMQAVEQGRLHLDEDINQWLPMVVENPHHPDEPITLRHLLTHTSGIVDDPTVYQSNVVFHFGGDNPRGLGNFLQDYLIAGGEFYSLEDNFLDSKPGIEFHYSNIAYGLIGYLIETVTEKPFNVSSRETILEPLKMTRSGWKPSEVDAGSTALQYGLAEGPYSDLLTGKTTGDWRSYPPFGVATYPDGGFLSTALDFSRFMTAIMNGGELDGVRILREETVDVMLRSQDLGRSNVRALEQEGLDSQALGFGYLSFPGMDDGLTWIGHNGGDPGRRAFSFLDPEAKIAVIVLMNSDPASESSVSTFFETILDLFENADALIGD